MQRNPAWGLASDLIHFAAMQTTPNPTHTHLEQAFVLLSCWKPDIAVKKLLTPCCSILSVSTPYPQLLFFPPPSQFHGPTIFLHLFLPLYVLLFTLYTHLPFILSSPQFGSSQVQHLQWNIKVKAMQRAVQSLDRLPSAPRALMRGESSMQMDASSTMYLATPVKSYVQSINIKKMKDAFMKCWMQVFRHSHPGAPLFGNAQSPVWTIIFSRSKVSKADNHNNEQLRIQN